jgi:hypothetical protein
MDNHQKAPMYINRVLNITKYLGDELQSNTTLHQRLLVEFILAETEKTFHVYGKLTKKQVESANWLPKTQVTDDPYSIMVAVVDLMCIMMMF